MLGPNRFSGGQVVDAEEGVHDGICAIELRLGKGATRENLGDEAHACCKSVSMEQAVSNLLKRLFTASANRIAAFRKADREVDDGQTQQQE